MKSSIIIFLLTNFITSCAIRASCQNTSIPHLQKKGTATQLIVEGKPFLMLAGELHNSSTSSLDYMRPLWQKMKDKKLNTVIAAVSWELIEKEQGQFDFSLVDSMIAGARSKGLHLVVIWFASWKNGGSTYMPSWVKKDVDRYPRVKDKNNKTLEILSAFSDASCMADANAFKNLMKHIKEVDQKEQTVIMVQVENEVGILNASRDYRTVASEAFNAPIPKALSDYLLLNKDNLTPELFEVWKRNGFKTKGNWEAVFGKGNFDNSADWKTLFYYTEELFMAYHYAKYIGKVAAEGKREYALPMYVNAWQKQPDTRYPGKYPSGGPLPHVLDMWRAGAPAIDIIAPDIYMPQFKWVCDQYNRMGNPLLIPETRGGAIGAARAFYVFGSQNAMCFSPFGIDGDYKVDEDLTKAYETLDQLKDIITANQGKGTMMGVLLDSTAASANFQLGGYNFEAKLQTWPVKNTEAGAIIVSTASNEFIVAGKGLDIYFTPVTPGNLPLAAIDYAEEGLFLNGQWKPGRKLNGDETHTSSFDGNGLKLPLPEYSIQKLKIYRYK